MAKISDVVAEGKADISAAKKAVRDAKEAKVNTKKRIKELHKKITLLTRLAEKGVTNAQNKLDRARKRAADNVANARAAKSETAKVADIQPPQEKRRRGRGRPRKNPEASQ